MTATISTSILEKVPSSIASLDLDRVALRLKSTTQWSDSEIERAIERYRGFLGVALGGGTVVPTEDIDEVWHVHILDTRSYVRDCDRVFGYYFHHTPQLSEQDDPEHADDFVATADRWFMRYGERYSGALGMCNNGGCDGGSCNGPGD